MIDAYRLLKIALALAIVLTTSESYAEIKLSLISSQPYQEQLATTFSPKFIDEQFGKVLAGKGIVVDERDFESIRIEVLRDIIVNRRKPLFIFGPQIWPADFHDKLKISPRLSSFPEQKKDQIQATGIFRRAVGSYYTISILARRAFPISRLLIHIDDAVNRMLTIDELYPVDKKGNSPYWDDDGDTHEVEYEDSFTEGLFRQRVSIPILRNDGSDDSDWWYIHIYNTVIPGENYMTKLNSNDAEGLNVKRLSCWGPTGVVKESSKARVEVGCPGPKEQWDWPTGMTTVMDKTRKGEDKGKWEVEFRVGEQDSKSGHEWQPGAQYETTDERKKELHLRMKVLVEWKDESGNVISYSPDSWFCTGREP